MTTFIRTNERFVNHYSDEFKRKVVEEHLKHGTPKDQLRAKYGIKGKSAILGWIRKFGAPIEDSMSKHARRQPVLPSDTSEEVARLKAENERLKKALAHEELHVKVLTTMIDIAERELKIPVRKKYGAKQ